MRAADLRPFERRIVDLLTGALFDEALPTDAVHRLEPSEVQITKRPASMSSAS